MTPEFAITHRDQKARTGVLHTDHGDIPTPNFMPVATRGVFHGMEIGDAVEAGVDVIMCNTFHLDRETGAEKIAASGGIHAHTGWSKPVATDSGGFQVFSYGWSRKHGVMKMAKGINAPSAMSAERGESHVTIDDDGVTLGEPGREVRYTAESSIARQELIGADILFAFDEPTSPFHDREYTVEAMHRTHAWASRCIAAKRRDDQLLLGVIQGGPFEDLRVESAKALAAMPFGGFAIGGSYDAGGAAAALRAAAPHLPEGKIRHILGIGWVKDIIAAVDAGADLFDCVEPVRRARHRNVLVGGVYRDIVPVARTQGDRPLVDDCDCQSCQSMTAMQIRALLSARDHAGSRALAIHNVRTMVRIMSEIRSAIADGSWAVYRDRWMHLLTP